MINKLKKVLLEPQKLILYLSRKNVFKLLSDRLYIKMIYKCYMNKTLNLDEPKTFNEKLQWLKLYDRNQIYTKLVDKYEVRKYVAQEIGEEYLIPLIGVWEKFDDIDFSKLPNQFVLKCTHDSGGLIICKDKNTFDVESARKKINKCIKRNYYYNFREWPYKNVKPRIICEQYITSKIDNDIKDFKFMCFNGEVKCSFVCSNRGSENGLNVDFYDIDWNHMPFERHYKNSGIIERKPTNYDLMIRISEKLSQKIPFVRVDLYEVDGTLYFGELTFYPGAGIEEFRPEEYDYLLGSWINI